MRLASLILQQPVLTWIEQQRAQGATWPAVRDALHTATNGEIAVTWQAIQGWARHDNKPASKSVA